MKKLFLIALLSLLLGSSAFATAPFDNQTLDEFFDITESDVFSPSVVCDDIRNRELYLNEGSVYLNYFENPSGNSNDLYLHGYLTYNQGSHINWNNTVYPDRSENNLIVFNRPYLSSVSWRVSPGTSVRNLTTAEEYWDNGYTSSQIYFDQGNWEFPNGPILPDTSGVPNLISAHRNTTFRYANMQAVSHPATPTPLSNSTYDMQFRTLTFYDNFDDPDDTDDNFTTLMCMNYVVRRCGDGMIDSSRESCDPGPNGDRSNCGAPGTVDACQGDVTPDPVSCSLRIHDDLVNAGTVDVTVSGGEGLNQHTTWIDVNPGTELTFRCETEYTTANSLVARYTSNTYTTYPPANWSSWTELFSYGPGAPYYSDVYTMADGTVVASCIDQNAGDTATCRAFVRAEDVNIEYRCEQQMTITDNNGGDWAVGDVAEIFCDTDLPDGRLQIRVTSPNGTTAYVPPNGAAGSDYTHTQSITQAGTWSFACVDETNPTVSLFYGNVACEGTINVGEEPYCDFDSLYPCGVDADEDITLSADIGNYTDVTQISFVITNPHGNDITLGTQTYNGDGTYTTTFNLANDDPFDNIFPELISNPLNIRVVDQNGDTLTYVNAQGQTVNCISHENVQPECHPGDFTINGVQNAQISMGSSVDFLCNGRYGTEVTIEAGNPITWFSQVVLSTDDQLSLRSVYPYQHVIASRDDSDHSTGPYTFTCTVETNLDEIASCNFDENVCTATLSFGADCGNGIREPGEAHCDDGNSTAGDGCNDTGIPNAQGEICYLEQPVCALEVSPTQGFAPSLFVEMTGHVTPGMESWARFTNIVYGDGDSDINLNEVAPYYTTHTYTTTNPPETFTTTWTVQNRTPLTPEQRNPSVSFPSTTCSEDITLLERPDVYIEKFQRNVSTNTPAGANSYTLDPVPVVSGQTIAYELVVTNSHTNTATDVEVSDILPQFFSGTVDPTSTCANFDGTLRSDMHWTIDSLAGGATCRIYFQGIITEDDYTQAPLSCDYRYYNTGVVEYNSVQAEWPVYAYLNAADLRIVKDFPASTVPVGGTTSFTITVYNDGDGNAYGVDVTDFLVAGFVFGNADQGGSYNTATRTISWNDIDIPAGSFWTTQVNLSIEDDNTLSGEVLCNTGVAADLCTDVDDTDAADCIEITLQLGEMIIDKQQMNWDTCQTQGGQNCNYTNDIILVDQGDTILYRIRYENASDVEIASFTLEDVNPWGVSIDARSSDPVGALTLLNSRTWSGGPLQPGDAGYLYLTGTLQNPTYLEYRNTGIVRRDGQQAEDGVLALIPQVRVDKMQRNVTTNDPELGVYMTDGTLYGHLDDVISYRIEYGNYTESEITNVTVSDIFASGFIMTDWSSDPDLADPVEITVPGGYQRQWNVGTLGTGQTGYILLTGYIASDFYPIYVNTGRIEYDGGMAEDAVVIELIDDTLIRKYQRNWTTNSGGVFGPNDIIVDSGHVVNYELRFANPSEVDPVTLFVTDIFPMGFEPQTWSSTLGTNGDFLPPDYNLSGFRLNTWELNLAPGQTGSIFITGVIVDTLNYSEFWNTGQAVCVRPDGLSCGYSESAVLARTAGFIVQKRAEPVVAQAGGLITFFLEFLNTGTEPLTRYTLTDYLYPTLDYIEGSAYYQYTDGSGNVQSGVLRDPTPITLTGGLIQMTWECGGLGALNDAPEICPLQPGSGGAVIFQTRVE